MNWSILAWLVFVAAVIALWVRINRNLWGDGVSPFNLLAFAWVGPLLVRGLHLSALERSWSGEVCWLIAWTTIALVLPCFMWTRLPDFQQPSVQQAWLESAVAVLRNRRFAWIVFFTFVVSFSAYIYNEFIRSPIGVPLISLRDDPTLVGEAFHVWGKPRETRGWALYLYVPIHLQCAILYVIGKVNSKRGGKGWVLVSLLYPTMTILKLARTDLVQALVPMLMGEYYLVKFSVIERSARISLGDMVRRHRYALASMALIILGVFAFERQFEELREGENASDLFQEAIGTDIHVGSRSVDSVLAASYGYFGIPWENFVDTYESVRPETRLGVGALRPLFAIFGQGPAMDKVIDQSGFGPADYSGAGHTGPINTYPFITILYLESGMVGIVIFPVLYSVFANRIYANFRRRPNFLNWWLYLQVPFAWMWLFSNAAFTALNFYLCMVFLWGLNWSYRKFCLTSNLRAYCRPPC